MSTHSSLSGRAHHMFSNALFLYNVMSFQRLYGAQVVSAKCIIHEGLMYRPPALQDPQDTEIAYQHWTHIISAVRYCEFMHIEYQFAILVKLHPTMQCT